MTVPGRMVEQASFDGPLVELGAVDTPGVIILEPLGSTMESSVGNSQNRRVGSFLPERDDVQPLNRLSQVVVGANFIGLCVHDRLMCSPISAR
jgi:hypothetical protein